MCATHIQNRKLSSSNDMTPFELWSGTRPDVSYLRIFDSPAFAHVPDEKDANWTLKPSSLY